MIRIVADINNGIMAYDNFDGFENLTIVKEDDFEDIINHFMEDDDEIGAEVSEETFERLNEEYGIVDRRIR